MRVTFRSYGKSRRQWDATFDLGSDEANGIAALQVAWKMNAEILRSVMA